jgi:hypothetical protein
MRRWVRGRQARREIHAFAWARFGVERADERHVSAYCRGEDTARGTPGQLVGGTVVVQVAAPLVCSHDDRECQNPLHGSGRHCRGNPSY